MLTRVIGSGGSEGEWYECWQGALLDAQTAITDGVWEEIGWLDVLSIHVTDVNSGDVLQIRASNALTLPANNSHEIQLGSDIVAAGLFQVQGPVRFLKVRKSVAGGTPGACNAILFGRKFTQPV